MEENTPMQEVDTVPQGQPHSSAAAEEAATGTTTENAEAEGTTPASAPGAGGRDSAGRRTYRPVQS